MENSIQGYAWGSETAIPNLLGEKPTAGKPMAELWMGAHAKAPSEVLTPNGKRSLIEVIAEDPAGVLGERVVKKFGKQLPFLFKVLAVARPLSIQAHPNKKMAAAGFAAENRLGIPLDAPNRNYRDDNHKPECICALTEFWGLCGFRNADEIFSRFIEIAQAAPDLLREIDALKCRERPLNVLFDWLMNLASSARQELIAAAVTHARSRESVDPASRWMLRLYGEYPADIGVVSPLLLNLVRLTPGQALFLPAGELHAYLEGVGIELMANSDNVLRGGLTGKHVDAPELGRVLHFREKIPTVLETETLRSGETAYLSPAEEFRLSVIAIHSAEDYRSGENRGVEVMICTNGRAEYIEGNDQRRMALAQGRVLLVPAAVSFYRLQGEATLYKASVP